MNARAQAIANLKAKLDAQRGYARTLQITAAPVKQDREMFLQIGRKRFRVANIADAVAKFTAARDASGYGASQMPRVTIVSSTGLHLYTISYNGRVWDLDGKPLDGETDEQRVARALKIA